MRQLQLKINEKKENKKSCYDKFLEFASLKKYTSKEEKNYPLN